MNFLAHILLSGPEPDLQIGGFLGDFVKGPLRGHYPAAVEAGIQLHRSIDAYTDTLPALRELRHLLPPHWHRYSGILSDVLHDHLLAQHWERYHSEPLDVFCRRFYRTLAAQQHLLPSNAQRLSQLGLTHPWLQNYSQRETIEEVLIHIGTRLRRPVPLQEALQHIEPHMALYQQVFEGVFPALQVFAIRERRLLLSAL